MTDHQDVPNDPIPSDLVRDDPSFADIVVDFVHGLNDRVVVMEDALRGRDFETLRSAAHQLKGSGGGYGYAILTEEASRLEKLARDQLLDECVAKVNEIRDLCRRVVVGNEE